MGGAVGLCGRIRRPWNQHVTGQLLGSVLILAIMLALVSVGIPELASAAHGAWEKIVTHWFFTNSDTICMVLLRSISPGGQALLTAERSETVVVIVAGPFFYTNLFHVSLKQAHGK